MIKKYRYRVQFDFLVGGDEPLNEREIDDLAAHALHLWPHQFPVFIKDLDRELFKVRLVETIEVEQ